MMFIFGLTNCKQHTPIQQKENWARVVNQLAANRHDYTCVMLHGHTYSCLGSDADQIRCTRNEQPSNQYQIMVNVRMNPKKKCVAHTKEATTKIIIR